MGKTQVLVVGAIAVLGVQAQAQSGHVFEGIGAARAFLPVEARFVLAFQSQGPKGIEGLTAPGFTIRYGQEHHTGRAAFAQIYSNFEGIQGGKVAVTIHRIKLTDTTAVVLTRQQLTMNLGLIKGRTATATTTQCWKQMWQHTGSGWKLGDLELISDKALGIALPIEYTVSSDGKSLHLDEASPDPKMS